MLQRRGEILILTLMISFGAPQENKSQLCNRIRSVWLGSQIISKIPSILSSAFPYQFSKFSKRKEMQLFKVCAVGSQKTIFSIWFTTTSSCFQRIFRTELHLCPASTFKDGRLPLNLKFSPTSGGSVMQLVSSRVDASPQWMIQDQTGESYLVLRLQI